jgi:ABC-type Fe3+/spermidine/putrescine transport system ATPase subunit
MSDRIAVMADGRVEQIGSPEAMYHSPDTIFVADFLGRANLLPARVTAVDGARVRVTVAGGHPIQVPMPEKSRPAAGAAATVMVRPERLQVGLQASGPVRLSATVVAVLFQGPVVRCELRAADGTALVAHLAPTEGGGLAPGQQAFVDWDPGSPRLLPPSMDGAP